MVKVFYNNSLGSLNIDLIGVVNDIFFFYMLH